MTSSTFIARPAHQVASFVLDWGNDALWRSQVQKFTVDPPGQATVGQRLVEHLTFAGMPFRTPTVIESAEPLAAAYSGGSRSVSVHGWRRITPMSETSCRVDVHTEITMSGALGMLTSLLAPGYRKTDAADVARLASVAARELR
ncbi:SRPBCC family protein [Nocardioides sp. Soil805]|uniref:SRPBCC family protein n=1 Tax=Nocardioides sp. Soil805 TaxID=1736416 RepID=UPI00138F606F|nr:SRPBCC family protein [Nocardioides sp. Soil805]